jgi:DNA topoisomerase-3
MSKTLIIAEKPSVAADLAKVLGGFKKVDDYYESDEYVLSSAVGHLLELCMPGEKEGKKTKWGFAHLPIVPDQFELKPIARSEPRLKLLKKLINRKDVTQLINACDAGREGELIFRYLVQHVGSKKPIRRLWLQSMTPTSIREGFTALRPGAELEKLAAAAVCRSESDWLVGINGTRAMTAMNSTKGGFNLTPVGRVQTPTLAIVVAREQKIRDFVSKDYWELHATFGAETGDYPSRWIDEKFKKADGDEDGKAERIWSKEKAEAIQKKCLGQPGVVTEEKKPTTQMSPPLFDLTSLQREANGRLGLSAKRTLQIAQSLYERHKVLTYPRTDSKALPEDYIPTVKAVLKEQAKAAMLLSPFAKKILANDWVKPNKRIFNNAKISDHFAIIPTSQAPTNLDEIETKLYLLVVKRFLAVFYPAAQFEVTTRLTRVAEEAFKVEGKILKDPGWLEIYGREEQADDDETQLVAVKPNEKVKTQDVELRGLVTKPPAHFTEATLLSAMEGAGKLVEDEELREAMAEKGLGTPATRAAIIEGLLLEKYLVREARDLLAMPKAFALIEMLDVAKIPGLSSPEMTGEWEFKLKQMERGELTRDRFMGEIIDLTKTMVERAKGFDENDVPSKPFEGKSPDGRKMVETLRNYQTEDGAFQLRKVVAGRVLEPHEAKDLIEKKFIGPLEGFRSRLGRPFAAALKLTEENKLEFVFAQEAVSATGEKLDLSQQEPVGICPIDQGKIYETFGAFACEHAIVKPATCTFRVGKKILGREITKEQILKLLSDKKTDLLPGFWSQRTKRPFSAHLILQPDGKIGFEFPPRAPKEPKGKKKGLKAKKGEEKAE